MTKKIILASNSPGRKEVLEKAGFAFEVIPSAYEEDMKLPYPPDKLAMHLSQGKARSVAILQLNAIVIGADTFGVLNGKLLGKPLTKEKAKEMLKELSGNVHSMVTGITVIDTDSKKELTRVDETKIWFKEISDGEIDEYIETGESLEKAGAYMFQGDGKKFIQKIEGSKTNLIGLPLEILEEILKELGYEK